MAKATRQFQIRQVGHGWLQAVCGYFLRGLIEVLPIIVVLPTLAATADPTLLQQQAITRIEAFLEHYRKTGDSRWPIADLQQTENELTASNQAFAARSDWRALAQGLFRLGQLYQQQAKWKPALTYYREAETTARRANDIPTQVKALTGLARVETDVNDYGSAASYGMQAVRLSEALTDQKFLFDALSVVSAIQIGQGNLKAAADTASRTFALAQKLDELSLFYSRLDRANVYAGFAQGCDNRGNFESCLAAIEPARADYQAALGLAHKLNYAGLAKLAEGLLSNLQSREQLIQAQQGLDQSLRPTAQFSPKKPADVLVTEEFVATGAFPAAFETPYRELEESQSSGFGESLRMLSVAGMKQQAQGNHDAALQSFLQAVELLERDRGKLRDERDRGAFLEDKVHIYYAAILQLLQHHRQAEAFELLERSRSRVMADLLASRPLGLVRPEERRLYGEVVNLKSRIAALQSKLPALTSQANPQAQQDAAPITAEIRQLEGDYQALVARIAKAQPRLNELLVSAPASLDKLQQSMRRENYEMLQYLVMEHGVILWHISADGVQVRNVFLPRSNLAEKITQLAQELEIHPSASQAPPTFDGRIARELFLFLVQPVQQWLKADRLVIIPHGDLHRLPFQVLQDPSDGHFLGERYALSYAPSATVLLDLKKAASLANGRLLAIADPDLDAAQGEVEAIARLYPQRAKVVKEPLAKEADVKAWAGDYDIVHLAVHGKFNATEPLLSSLQLGSGGQDDGQLTAAEIFGLPLDHTRLVVLSACETGKAEVTAGNEILGMMRGLLYAGAGSLVLSYWPVESQATARWMESFYRAAQSVPPAEAARRALQAVREQPEYQHPYFWAAFMTVSR